MSRVYRSPDDAPMGSDEFRALVDGLRGPASPLGWDAPPPELGQYGASCCTRCASRSAVGDYCGDQCPVAVRLDVQARARRTRRWRANRPVGRPVPSLDLPPSLWQRLRGWLSHNNKGQG